MKVWQLVELLKKMPQDSDVKTDNGRYLDDPRRVEHDERDYVIIRIDDED
ncbi:hypothetical protein ACFYU8_18060 [Brevibacillus sp. NPDC003359]